MNNFKKKNISRKNGNNNNKSFKTQKLANWQKVATTYGTLDDDWVESEEHLHNVRQVDALGKRPLDARQGPHYSPRGVPRRVKVACFAEQAQARPRQLLRAWVCSHRPFPTI
jgi:hypothetical protein